MVYLYFCVNVSDRRQHRLSAGSDRCERPLSPGKVGGRTKFPLANVSAIRYNNLSFAGVMELVDVLDSKSSGATRAGSTPAASIFPGRLAQLGEHLPYKQGVSGSIPLTSIF